MVILYILVIVSIALSLINIFFLFKFVKTVQENQIKNQQDVTEDGNIFLARFQKITSTRLRALDNKIEIVDQLLQDLDEAYMKTYSLLSDLESKLSEQKREERLEKQRNIDSPANIKVQKQAEKNVKNFEKGKRVYELSREIKVETKDLINFINRETELQIYSHLQKLTPEEELTIKNKLSERKVIEEKKEEKQESVFNENVEGPIVNVNRFNADRSSEKKEKIIELYEQGLSPQEIGKELKIGVGEIMLVLSLFNQD